jgi:ketosteroid isomerase-like protein
MYVARLLPIVMLTVCAALPLSAQSHGDARTAAAVTSLVARYDSAWNRRDSAAVSRLLAPDYQYFTSRGGISNRSESLTFLSSKDYVLDQAKRTEVSVTVSGPVAVVSSRWQGQGSYRGEAFKDDQRCGQTWLRTDRAWQLVSEHCVQIQP